MKHIFGAVVLGFLLMAPLAKLFDKMDWPLFQTWGLAHGSFIFAWPLLTILNLAAFKVIPIARERWNRNKF